MGSTEEFPSLQDLLRSRATQSSHDEPGNLMFYPLGNTLSPIRLSYSELYRRAKSLGEQLINHSLLAIGKPILIHLDDHHDTLLYFWAVLLSGGVPVITSPQSLSNTDEYRTRHLDHLALLFESPVCITRKDLLHQFECIRNAKAVCLTHRQVQAAVRGKALVRDLHVGTKGKRAGTFFNWIGLDHVASLVEIHLQALYLNADQVHVHAADVVSSPYTFLDLCSRHAVVRTFAPNFFLASLASESCQGKGSNLRDKQELKRCDLSYLRLIASGGEANDVQTCNAVNGVLAQFGAKRDDNIILPGFGMTETCAGAIYNSNFPAHDISSGYKFASVGKCMQGIEMRITRANDDSTTGRAELAPPSEIGNLEVRGEVVFQGYYRDPVATAQAFTSDGWFRTGDRAFLDNEGNLCLAGRLKDVVNVNGVKIPTTELQSAVVAAYMTTFWPIDGKDMAEIQDTVSRACVLVNASCGKPVVFGLSERSMALLPVSTLGKVSGAKMRTMFELGVFDDDLSFFKTTVGDWRKDYLSRAPQEVGCFLDDEQKVLRSGVAEICNVEQVSVDLDVSFFHLGFTSMDVIRLKHRIDKGLHVQVAVIDIMKNPTRRNEKRSHEYDPIVTLRSTGTKSPLWLVHPGVGEVLVFVALAKHMDTDDRPIHALRARGFEPGQPKFASITDTVETYVAAIRRMQPSGPYCLAGYSYGAMLAFEVAKRLEDVKFLGSFNLPPHIKTRMRQLGWSMCLLHLAQFLGLLTERIVEDETSSDTYRSRGHESALHRVVELSVKSRMAELGLTRDSLARWTDVAYGLQSMAADYEPSGAVDSIDVFHAEPLKVAASSREAWVTEHLGRWADFSRTTPRLHAVGGAHYTMLGAEHVGLFARKLKQALAVSDLGLFGKTVDRDTRRDLIAALRKTADSLEDEIGTLHRYGHIELEKALVQIGLDLEIFKRLTEADGPLTVDRVSEMTNSDPQLMRRLLRYYAAVNILSEVSPSTFTATNLTHNLVKPVVTAALGHYYGICSAQNLHLPSYLKSLSYQNPTDETNTAFHQAYHTTLSPFQYMAQRDPAQLEHFNTYMALRRDSSSSWLSAYPLMERLAPSLSSSDSHRVLYVNIGGGIGHQCSQFRDKYPPATLPGRVILQDLPATIEQALATPGVENMAWDFFSDDKQPIKGALIYYMRGVPHNHPAHKVKQLFAKVKEAMSHESRLLIDETVLPDMGVGYVAASIDLTMMGAFASMERTESDWKELVQAVGLEWVGSWEYNSAENETVMEVRLPGKA
ncbi:hypothetical protein V8F33_006518 [Rhypophila sp. PSN 637]